MPGTALRTIMSAEQKISLVIYKNNSNHQFSTAYLRKYAGSR